MKVVNLRGFWEPSPSVVISEDNETNADQSQNRQKAFE